MSSIPNVAGHQHAALHHLHQETLSSAAQESPTCWQQTVEFAQAAGVVIKEGAIQVGTWIANQTMYAAAWLKEAFSWLGQAIVEVGTAIKDWALALFEFLCDTAVKAYEFVAPHFATLSRNIRDTAIETYQFVVDFINAHPNETIVGAVALVAGVVATLVIERVCCCCC
jgi:hypothetical protein